MSNSGFFMPPKPLSLPYTQSPIPLPTESPNTSYLIPNTKSPSLRSQYPFLSDPNCPAELKILAADKITSYHQYCQAHRQLVDCISLDQQFTTVKQLVETFIDNRSIHKEFQYYLEHGHTLGQHQVFQHLNELRALQKLSDIELYQLQEKLKHNIWRIQDQLSKKNDKPHLRLQREKRLHQKQAQLTEIENILSKKLSH